MAQRLIEMRCFYALLFVSIASFGCTHAERSNQLVEHISAGEMEKLEIALRSSPVDIVQINEAFRYVFSTPSTCSARARIAKLLISKGADVDYEDDTGTTPLLTAISSNCDNLMEMLLDAGANIDKPNRFSGETPLMFAIEFEKYQLASILLHRGASPNLGDFRGKLPIHVASPKSPAFLKEFLAVTTEGINARDSFGLTPIFYTLMSEMKEEDIYSSIRLLLANGACLNLCFTGGPLPDSTIGYRLNPLPVPHYGESPLDFARRTRQTKIVELIGSY